MKINPLSPLLLGFCLLLCSCGYTFVGASPISMPQGKRMLNITHVQNPTQEAWLEPYLRSYFQDEFTRRGNASWVPEDQAQGLVRMEISQFRTADGLTRERDRTVKANVTIVLEAMIFSATNGELIWSSGSITGRSSYFLAAEDTSLPGSMGPEQRRASEEAVEQAVTRLADRLGDGF
ncbi:LPS assembly lipoprotein LptE [Desulfonatronovibrio hydrogenovorans]|uniref:LPS assembly lipoprotein LptE n=1 Tax=Desulfonatronovibrio hydrogenovorans TaxID=53245 RepID=UPI00048A571B|nr:LPS assembly lipoprotein LptE [Desulfonatronovibrio hydrogenovorans]